MTNFFAHFYVCAVFILFSFFEPPLRSASRRQWLTMQDETTSVGGKLLHIKVYNLRSIRLKVEKTLSH